MEQLEKQIENMTNEVIKAETDKIRALQALVDLKTAMLHWEEMKATTEQIRKQ